MNQLRTCYFWNSRGKREESKVEELGLEEKRTDRGEVNNNEVEGSDWFEDCE